MRARILLLAVGVVVLGVGAFLFLQSDAPRAGSDLDPMRDDVARIADRPDVGLESVADTGAGNERTAVTAAAASGPDVAASAADHPWAGELGGITGRLVEEDGTPVEGLEVGLLEVDLTSMFEQRHQPLGIDSPEIDTAKSGADGRFVLDGARNSAYHGLSIGRGTGRATLRVIDQAIEHGVRTDLGDIVLPAFGTIVGTVIDEDGEPVAGARVRALPVPRVALDVGILDVREGVAVLGREDDDPIEQSLVVDVPDRAFHYLELMPIPTTTTAVDGTFRLEGVPPGSIAGGADHPGYVAAVFGQVDLEAGAEVDVGELELLFGREVTGRVVDIAGDPVAGVEVALGATIPFAPVAILHPAGVTDENGEVLLEGIPETGTLVGAARRRSADEWVRAEARGLSETLEFTLTTSKPLLVRLSDVEGEPVSGAELRLRSTSAGTDMFAGLLVAEIVGGQDPKALAATETEPGLYSVPEVTYGSWQVEARADGYATTFGDVEHRSEGTILQMTMTGGAALDVTAVDGATGEPVPNVHVTLLGPRGPMFDAYCASFTGADGHAKLGPLGENWYDDMNESARSFFRGANVVAEHPRYGKAVVQIEANTAALTVEMPVACTVEGRVHWEGENPPGLYMLALRQTDVERRSLAPALSPPRTALSNVEGRFRFTGVAPGEYKLTVMERWLEGDPIMMIVDQKEPRVLDDRSVTVDVGDPTFVDVALSSNGEGPRGRFVGRITSQGAPLAGIKVDIKGRRDAGDETLYTDGDGSFESEEYSVMSRFNITIEGDVPLPNGSVENRQIFQEWRRPVAGEPDRIDIDLSYQMLVVEVRDASSGEALAGVTGTLAREARGDVFRFRGSSNTAETSNDQGRIELVVPTADAYSLTLQKKGYAKERLAVTSSTLNGSAPHLVVELQGAVPCAGTAVLPEGRQPGRSWIRVFPTGEEPDDAGEWTNVDEESHFEVEGLLPGEYTAELWGGAGRIQREFRLGSRGDDDLLLDFVN